MKSFWKGHCSGLSQLLKHSCISQFPLFLFLTRVTSPRLISGIMLPLFSLPTIALRLGRESCNISRFRTLLSVLGSLSTAGLLGLLVSYFKLCILPFTDIFIWDVRDMYNIVDQLYNNISCWNSFNLSYFEAYGAIKHL